MKLEIWTPLPAASKYWCGISFTTYFYLVLMGITHFYEFKDSINTQRLRMECIILCILYFFEVCLALYTSTSTLYRWRKFEYISHHIPFGIVILPAMICDPIAAHLGKYTFSLVLLLNAQELYRVLNQNNIKYKIIDQLLPFYVFIVVIPLIFVEIWENINFWLYIPREEISYFGVFLSLSGLSFCPIYHTFIVVPSAFKRMKNVLGRTFQSKPKYR